MSYMRDADGKRLDEFVVMPNPVVDLTGGTARWYGDSWAAGFGLGAGQSYIQLAATEHGITTFENRAVSGSALQSVGTLMVWGGSPYEWTEGDADLLVINAGINDARYNDLSLAANAEWLTALEHSLRIALAVGLGKQRVVWDDNTRWTYAGAGWFGGPYFYSTNGTSLAATANPNTSATFTFTGDEVTVICGGYYEETTCVADFYIDDEHVRTVRFHDDIVLYPSSATTVGYRAERFTGLGPGPHTVTIIKVDTTSAFLYIDSAIERSSTPPLVLVNKEPTLPSAVYSMYDPYDNGNDASIYAMQRVVDDVASEFTGVRLCNLPVLTPVTDFQGDLIHPDSSGRDKLQAAVSTALGAPELVDHVEDIAVDGRIRRTLETKPAVVSRFSGAVLASYRVPKGAVALRIRALGGGGGGGSGRRGAAGTIRCGGGGGAGAGFCDTVVSTYGLPSTLYVTAGTGGAGGAAVAVDDTNGNDGVAGVASYVTTTNSITADEGIFLAHAPGGNRGRGGTNATGTAGAAAASFAGLTGAGAAASTAGLVGASPSTNGYNGVGQGAGAGGGLTAANAQSAGGSGWWSGLFIIGTVSAPIAGTAGGGNGASGAPASSLQGRLLSEASGAGGGSNAAGAGGAGGAGGRGSGGGGGGASVNGSNSGAGGAGGAGFVEITAYF